MTDENGIVWDDEPELEQPDPMFYYDGWDDLIQQIRSANQRKGE